jgi:hypothetical protein
MYKRYSNNLLTNEYNYKKQGVFISAERNLNLQLSVYTVKKVSDLPLQLRPRNRPPPPQHIWANIRGRYWPAKINDISL